MGATAALEVCLALMTVYTIPHKCVSAIIDLDPNCSATETKWTIQENEFLKWKIRKGCDASILLGNTAPNFPGPPWNFNVIAGGSVKGGCVFSLFWKLPFNGSTNVTKGFLLEINDHDSSANIATDSCIVFLFLEWKISRIDQLFASVFRYNCLEPTSFGHGFQWLVTLNTLPMPAKSLNLYNTPTSSLALSRDTCESPCNWNTAVNVSILPNDLQISFSLPPVSFMINEFTVQLFRLVGHKDNYNDIVATTRINSTTVSKLEIILLKRPPPGNYAVWVEPIFDDPKCTDAVISESKFIINDTNFTSAAVSLPAATNLTMAFMIFAAVTGLLLTLLGVICARSCRRVRTSSNLGPAGSSHISSFVTIYQSIPPHDSGIDSIPAHEYSQLLPPANLDTVTVVTAKTLAPCPHRQSDICFAVSPPSPFHQQPLFEGMGIEV